MSKGFGGIEVGKGSRYRPFLGRFFLVRTSTGTYRLGLVSFKSPVSSVRFYLGTWIFSLL